MLLRLCSFILLGCTACGYTSEGSGTKTLTVTADLSYSAGSDDRTRVRITILKDGVRVSNASVTLTDGDTDATFSIPQDNNSSGNNANYRADISGFHRKMELEIKAGNDHLEARLEGPGRHQIKEPANDSVVSGGKTLHVEWKTNDGIAAEQVEISLEQADYSNTLNDDPGSVDITGSTLRSGAETVSVRRQNSVRLAGGASGSLFFISYRASNDITVSN